MKSEKSSLKKGKKDLMQVYKQKKGSYPKYIKNHHSQEKKDNNNQTENLQRLRHHKWPINLMKYAPIINQGNTVKVIMRYHNIPIILAKVLSLTITSVEEDAEQQELSYIIGENMNYYNYLRSRTVSTKRKIRQSHDLVSNNSISGHYPKETMMICITIHTWECASQQIQRLLTRNNLKCPPTVEWIHCDIVMQMEYHSKRMNHCYKQSNIYKI